MAPSGFRFGFGLVSVALRSKNHSPNTSVFPFINFFSRPMS